MKKTAYVVAAVTIAIVAVSGVTLAQNRSGGRGRGGQQTATQSWRGGQGGWRTSGMRGYGQGSGFRRYDERAADSTCGAEQCDDWEKGNRQVAPEQLTRRQRDQLRTPECTSIEAGDCDARNKQTPGKPIERTCETAQGGVCEAERANAPLIKRGPGEGPVRQRLRDDTRDGKRPSAPAAVQQFGRRGAQKVAPQDKKMQEQKVLDEAKQIRKDRRANRRNTR